MREILTVICADKNTVKHHYCFEGVDLTNVPYSRVGEPIKRLRTCTDIINMTFDKINKNLLVENPDKIYRTFNGSVEEYYTLPEGADEYVIYRVDKIEDDKPWTIKNWGGLEYVKVYSPEKNTLNAPVDTFNKYCADISSKSIKEVKEIVGEVANVED